MRQGIHLHTPKLTTLNKGIIAAVAISFIVQFIVGRMGINLGAMLGLIPNKVLSGHIYQLITFPFPQSGFIGAFFDCMIIWFIGCDLEETWGKKTYSMFLISSLIGSALIYTVIGFFFAGNIPMIGVNGITYALLMGYAIMYPERLLSFMMIFPVKAKYFCPLIILILAFYGFTSPYGQASLGHLAAMFAGFMFLRVEAKYKVSRIDLMAKKREADKQKRRAHLRLVKGKDDDHDPKYFQ